MTDRIKLNIGRRSGLDGGPFFAVTVLAVEGEHFRGRTDEGHTIDWHGWNAQEDLKAEMKRNEPVSVSGVAKGPETLRIGLPVLSGYFVEAGDGTVYDPDGPSSTLAETQRAADETGATLRPVN